MVYYHINHIGRAEKCVTGPTKCTVKPHKKYNQFHAKNTTDIYNEMSKQYKKEAEKYAVSKLPENIEITAELLGETTTDQDRLLIGSQHKKSFGNVYHLWLTDTENHPIAYIKVSLEDSGLYLYDIEVRKQFRGYGISKRIIRAVEQKFKKKMQHEGIYTIEGLKKIAPLFHDSQWIEKEQEHVAPSMRFVIDWDHKIPRYDG